MTQELMAEGEAEVRGGTERQRVLIGQMRRLVAWRTEREADIGGREAAADARAAAELNAELAQVERVYERECVELTAKYREEREATFCSYESAGFRLLVEEQAADRAAEEKHVEALESAKMLCQHKSGQIVAEFKERSMRPKAESAVFRQQAAVLERELGTLWSDLQAIVRRRCAWPVNGPPLRVTVQNAVASPVHLGQYRQAVQSLLSAREALLAQPAGKFVEEGWPILIAFLAVPASIYPLWRLLGAIGGIGWVAAAALVSALLLGLIARQVGLIFAKRQTRRLIPELERTLATAQGELTAAGEAARGEAEQKYRDEVAARDRALKGARRDWKRVRRQEKTDHQMRRDYRASQFESRRSTIVDQHEQQFAALEAEFPPRLAQKKACYLEGKAALLKRHETRLETEREDFQREWSALRARWDEEARDFEAGIGAMNGYCDARYRPWKQHADREVVAAFVDVAAVRIGSYSEGEKQLPVLLSYPDCPSLVLQAEGTGRAAAVSSLKNTMLRLLTIFAPGKVRFTIIDPVGLGENFSAFMHLADYDPRLVNSRIWTEAAHIQQRLADLTQHMEDVIQKYLRNEFASIQEYNQQAGEVAEPYHILVVANFPANFSDEAARRLVSIAKSGPRCGVFTLISTDRGLALPRGFDLEELEQQATTLAWNSAEARFQWQHADLAALPLELETPPDDEQFTSIVRAIGKQAKQATRVEVPFESVLPAADAWWSADSRNEIEVPLGRAGARKLQRLKLGRGTSQHVLIAGKTGSGKSTLLNALITNLAAHYSPEELQFYLIDFKKGVEFKAYATFRLPHARVIAIESEREFGLSVLERLDLELKRRGDLFRQQGVQDVAGFRQANPSAVMPRILLVIDEFQEFFTSDDQISHAAALYLDRLVRQGRAFGIHVLLGSQTLAGAYTLARSTLGQMAVRIALQCSESDAHLILSEDNTAARLLNRPGEAIYNDANGLIEGNHPFQVVWLADHERENHLRRLADLAHGRGTRWPPPVVFEGNVAADPASNPLLQEVLLATTTRSGPPRAWLGAPVAIKDPTTLTFERQPASHLLIVGQNEELALGMLANALLALAAQVRSEPDRCPSFFVLDGTRPDSASSGFWSRVRSQTTFDPRIVQPRDAAEVVRSVAAEVHRRLENSETGQPSVFLIWHDMARFRDLRKADDFGLSFDATTTGVAQQLATILREGPAVGVHVLAWVDGLATLTRWLERSSIRDFGMRALMQMSASDSSQLMDSPAASRLGAQFAYYFSEEMGVAEKFRPYAVPTPAWLAEISQLMSRAEVSPGIPIRQSTAAKK